MIIYFKVKNKEKILLFLSALLAATSLLVVSAIGTNLLTTPSGPTAGFIGVHVAYALDGVCKDIPNGLTGIAAGGRHSCILIEDGNVHCRGYNSHGQANDYLGGDAVAVATGGHHSCFLKSDGSVDCQGYNFYGQANDYTGSNAVGVAAGWSHTCFLKSDGNVDCQGMNDYSQADDYTGSNAVGVAAGEWQTCFLKSDGNVDCQGRNDYSQADDYIGGDAVGVGAGQWHSCFLKSDGDVDCQGSNIYGRANDYLGGDAVGVAVGFDMTCFLKSDGNVDCQGNNHLGQADDYTGSNAVGVAAGKWHTCFLKSDGNVDCQGDNGNGQADDYFGGDAVCQIPVCGNGVVEGSETCDDGNTTPGDGCSNTCTVETGFTCPTPGSPCTAICGDGLILGSEACDDGNTTPDDGCDNLCDIEDGYICLSEPSVCSAGRRNTAPLSQAVLAKRDYSTTVGHPSYLIEIVDLDASSDISSLFFTSLNDPPVEIFNQEELAAGNSLIAALIDLIAQIKNYLGVYQIDPEPLYETAPDVSGSEAYFVPLEAGDYLFGVAVTFTDGSSTEEEFTVTAYPSAPRAAGDLFGTALECNQYEESNEYWSRLYYIDAGEEELNSILEDVQYQVKSSIPPECLILYEQAEVPPPVIESKDMDQGVDHYYELMEKLFEDLLEPEDEEIFETIVTEEIRTIIQRFYEVFTTQEEGLKAQYQEIIDEIFSVGYYDFPGFLRYSEYGFRGVRMIEDIKNIFSGLIPNELLGSYLDLTRSHSILATIRTYNNPEGIYYILNEDSDYDISVVSPELISKSELFELIDDILGLSMIFKVDDPLLSLGIAQDFEKLNGTIGRDDAFTLYYRLQQLNYFLRAEYNAFGFSPDDGQDSREEFRDMLLEKYTSIANIRRLLEAQTNDVVAEYWTSWHEFLDINAEPFISIKEIIFASQDPVEILRELKDLLD